MEYVFGSREHGGVINEVLKTIGTEHSNLSGQVIIKREYVDSHITDSFIVMEHYASKEDPSGQCYDWYTINNHYRYEDKYTPNIAKIEDQIENITPYMAYQKAYIGDTEVIFQNVPKGNLSVYVEDSEGNYLDYKVVREGGVLTVTFEPLENVTTITITIG